MSEGFTEQRLNTNDNDNDNILFDHILQVI